MEEKGTVARPYALAAFKQAQEEGQLSEWSEMLRFLGGVTADPMMAGIVADPRVPSPRLADLMLEIGKDRLSRTGENFVRLLAENGRLGLVREIADIFDQEFAAAEGRGQVEVVSAFKLDASFRDTITGAMEKRLGCAVDLSVRVDKSLIGGVVIRAGDVVIDLSVRGRLDQLATRLS